MPLRSVLLGVLALELTLGGLLLGTGYLSRHPAVPELPPMEVKA